MQKYRNQIITSFVGYSGSGKTTFIEKLIKELKVRGRSVAVIKHDAHEFDIDKEG
ncbi:MAG: molybdopterin-guanine dinucleotide biosynthesis protein MobB, partial [Lachnospiraceae bacterium]|nr:molybdopterin-guanine dinucleotide biosynthesis protein MobB [Lachnospiraceae bacterium]